MKMFSPIILFALMLVTFSTSVAQYLTSAKLYLRQREYEQAEASAMKAVAKDPDDEEAWFVLGQARFEVSKFSEMLDAFDKSLSIKPEEYRDEINRYKLSIWANMYNAGVKYYNKGRDTAAYLDMALDSLKVSIKAMPDSSTTYYVAALAYYAKQEYPDAISMLNACLKRDPSKSDVIQMLGQLHMQTARDKRIAKDSTGAAEAYKLAVAAFEKLYESDPLNAENIVSLIDVYERAGMSEKALILTSDCVKKDPKNRVCRFAYGVYLLKQNNFPGSIEQFGVVLDIDPTEKDDLYKDATYNLGVAHLNWGVAIKDSLDKQAEEDRKAKKKLNEKENLTYKEHFKRAVPFLERTSEFRNDDAGIFQQLGKLYATLNMTKEATAAYEKADKLMKGN